MLIETMAVTMRRWKNQYGAGESCWLTIPREIRDHLGWQAGDRIEITVMPGPHLLLRQVERR